MGQLGEPRARVQKQKKRAFAVWRKRDKATCILPQSSRVAPRRATDGFQTSVWLHSQSTYSLPSNSEHAAFRPGCRLTCTMHAVLELVFSRWSPTHLGKAFCLVSCVSCPSLISIPPLPSFFSSPLPPSKSAPPCFSRAALLAAPDTVMTVGQFSSPSEGTGGLSHSRYDMSTLVWLPPIARRHPICTPRSTFGPFPSSAH